MDEAILNINTFGVHIIYNSNDTFSFFGECPKELIHSVYDSFDSALNDFFDFFEKQDVDWQRKNIGNMRNDIFVKFMERK